MATKMSMIKLMKESYAKHEDLLKGCFFALISLFFVTGALFIVYLTAPRWLTILNQDAAHIGNAIGGVGTVVVGIMSTAMLYLAFKRQGHANTTQAKSLELQKIEIDSLKQKMKNDQEDREDEKERNQHTMLIEQLNRTTRYWTKTKISSPDGKQYSIDDSIKLLDKNDSSNLGSIGTEILTYFLEINNFLKGLSEVRKNNRKKLLDKMVPYYKTVMEKSYERVQIILPTEQKNELAKLNHEIIEILFHDER